MFIYPFPNIIKRHGLHFHGYADDIQLYMQCRDRDFDIHVSIPRFQNCILKMSNYIMVNSLNIKGDKAEFIIFGSKPASKYYLKICFSVIPATTSIKTFGVSLDSMLNLNKHIPNTCRTVYYASS